MRKGYACSLFSHDPASTDTWGPARIRYLTELCGIHKRNTRAIDPKELVIVLGIRGVPNPFAGRHDTYYCPESRR